MINLLELGRPFSKREAIFPYIVQIGMGGTSGYVIQMVAQMLSIFTQNAFYLIADPDIIEEKILKINSL